MRRYGIIQVTLFGCMAPVWLVMGVQTCRRRIGAIRLGLYLEYIILVPAVVIGVILMLAGTGLCLLCRHAAIDHQFRAGDPG